MSCLSSCDWRKKHNFLLKVAVDERRIRFEVCSVKPWKTTGVEEPVCEAEDGHPGGRERIEVFCDDAAFSNLASARFSPFQHSRIYKSFPASCVKRSIILS